MADNRDMYQKRIYMRTQIWTTLFKHFLTVDLTNFIISVFNRLIVNNVLAILYIPPPPVT